MVDSVHKLVDNVHKSRHYPYSTVERADLAGALWRHHGVRATVVVTFDYTSLALLELLRRQLERPTSGEAGTVITATFMVNGGLFADAHTHPWQGTPLLRTPLRALVPQASVLTCPGGHLATSEHPDLPAAAIREIAARHGVGTPATAHR